MTHITELEGKLLHEMRWQSGTGWENQRDWWLEREGMSTIYADRDQDEHGGDRFDEDLAEVRKKVADEKARAAAPALLEALEDAQIRLRGAGMLGGDHDPVNAAIKAATKEPST